MASEVNLRGLIPEPWRELLATFLNSPEFARLEENWALELKQGVQVFPKPDQIFNALALVPPDQVRVVILGQDPYHGERQAMGLSFSVPNELHPKPPSLRNILTELSSDLGVILPEGHSDLTSWAKQGVLLLNTLLTVRAHDPLSHENLGWQPFTDEVLRRVSAGPREVVFVLWGAHAQKKKGLLELKRHALIESPHPSPLSAYRGFFGSKVFSRINQSLLALGHDPVDWGRVL